MGPYDNESSQFVSSKDWEDGLWLVDSDGILYIVPRGGDGVEGPEDAVAESILHALGRSDHLTDGQAESLGLSVVPSVLKRFDRAVGYHTA